MKKKLLSFLVAICLIIPCLCLVGCNDTKSSKVMTLKVNPEIEFVLDKDNKVVTVNALNEDCYAILTATWGENEDATTVSEKLVGMQADEASELFIKVCDQEHFIQVNATSNVEISISGDNVNNLYNQVKSAIESVELEAKNIVLECEKLVKIKKDELVATAKECYKELSDDYLNGLTEEELVAKIKESREETKDFLNTQVKEFYYQMRDKYILMARLEAADRLGTFKTYIEEVQKYIGEIANDFNTKYFDATSEFRAKTTEYINAKKEWLATNISGATEESFEKINQSLTYAQNALNSAMQQAQQAIDSALSTIGSTLKSIEDLLLDAISQLPGYAQTLETKLETKMSDLNAQFAVDGAYASFNINFWVTTPAE